MAAPTVSDIKKLDFSYKGQPFCRIANIDTRTLDFSYQGQPFFATYTAVATGYNIYINSIQASKIYVGSTEATTVYIGTIALKF